MGVRGKGQALEQMLDSLARLGFRLAPRRRLEDLTGEWAREQLEHEGYAMVLVALGGEMIDPRTFETVGALSHDVWHLDTACIEATGDYVAIIDRIVLLAGGDLGLSDVGDAVDVLEGQASVSWTVKGRPQRFDLAVEGQDIDRRIFALLENELVAAGSSKRIYGSVPGPDLIVVCVAESRMQALADLTGLDFAPLA